MLELFRRYQKYLFIVVTIVIVISFSFFGTYSAIQRDPVKDRVVFKAIDGTAVKQSELEEMALFISTDHADKEAWGGVWGPNFLNDGVIKKDFLETGLAQALATQYMDLIKKDLETRLVREKRYVPYRHPQVSFLSAENAWGYFAPNLKANLYELLSHDRANDPAAFDVRVQLYLDERKFPANFLRYVLRNQEKQYSFVEPDVNLMQTDLSLFGYHTIDDWFGKGFVRLISEFIINASIMAEKKGYQVSHEEALADLLRNNEISYQQNLQNPNLGVANSGEYFQEQLRRLNLDQNTAVRTWQHVLLFRRLFNDVGSAAFLDPFTYEKFNQYAQETVEGDLYRLPKELRFKDFNSLQKLEWYLEAVSKRPEGGKSSLSIPTTFKTIGEIAADYPELIQKRYLLSLAEVDKKNLQSKIGLKETWNWEVDEKNWALLKQEFPELRNKPGNQREERFVALDSLDDGVRARVDQYARSKIVDAHPEWLKEALETAEGKVRLIGLSAKGGVTPFAGLKDREPLLALLNQASLQEAEPNEAAQKLQSFTADNQMYYKIKVLDRDTTEEILTFAEANQNGVIDPLLNKDLEAYYLRIREISPEKYQQNDKSWLSFAEVRNEVAAQYYSKLLKAIEADYKTTEEAQNPLQFFSPDVAASRRFMSYLKEVSAQIKQNPEKGQIYLLSEESQEANSQKLTPRVKLQDQWKLEKIAYKSDRASQKEGLNQDDIFKLAKGQWSDVKTSSRGELYFFQLQNKGETEQEKVPLENFAGAQRLISNEAKRNYFSQLIQEIKQKEAISIDYLNKRLETAETDV
jgi:GcvH upstream region-like protein